MSKINAAHLEAADLLAVELPLQRTTFGCSFHSRRTQRMGQRLLAAGGLLVVLRAALQLADSWTAAGGSYLSSHLVYHVLGHGFELPKQDVSKIYKVDSVEPYHCIYFGHDGTLC